MNRRSMFGVLLALALAVATAMPALGADKVRIGYLHTLAVDAQFWIAMEKGYFKEQGLEIEPIKFTSGVPMMQALSGGSMDVGIMGAVISNFPAQGVGKIFMANSLEYDTAMIFARPDTGAKSIKDLRGKKVATVKGTTAHVYLHTALQANGMDSQKDIELISMDMAGAVSAFISGAVPYVCTWAPFHVLIRDKVPGAILLGSAKDYYPKATIVGGWVAANDYYAKKKDVLARLIKAWAKANDELLANPAEMLKFVHAKAYAEVPFADIQASWEKEKCFTSKEWYKYYQDGTLNTWIGQVQKVFVEIGSMNAVVDPKTFFDPSIYLSAVKP